MKKLEKTGKELPQIIRVGSYSTLTAARCTVTRSGCYQVPVNCHSTK